MAYDEGIAAMMRTALGSDTTIVEKKMFGGLVFMRRGNMLCGSMSDGAMYRVGNANEVNALVIENVEEIHMGTRRMNGFVRVRVEHINEDIHARLLALAMIFNESLPQK